MFNVTEYYKYSEVPPKDQGGTKDREGGACCHEVGARIDEGITDGQGIRG